MGGNATFLRAWSFDSMHRGGKQPSIGREKPEWEYYPLNSSKELEVAASELLQGQPRLKRLASSV